MSANDKYHGQVFSEEQMDLLLDRSDLAWEGKTDTKPATASTGIKGVFQVVEVDDKKKDLSSVKEEVWCWSNLSIFGKEAIYDFTYCIVLCEDTGLKSHVP